MLLHFVFLISLSWIPTFASSRATEGESNLKTTIRNPNGVTEAATEEGQTGDRVDVGKGLEKRNLGLYPGWFRQKIKKLVGNRFMHDYFSPSEYHSNIRNDIPTKNYRRSFYGLSELPHGLNQFEVPEEFTDNSITPQSSQGAQLVNLPNNLQELSPEAFHEFTMHGGGELVELPNTDDDILIDSHQHHRHHHHYNHCHRRPCLNGGSCIHHRHSTVSFRCSCRAGFKGHYCEIPAVSCVPNPCHNDGSCTLHDHGYFCTCPADFKGPSCSVQASCFSHPCQNGGTCIELDSGYTCTCVTGFEGQSCEEKIDVCKSNPCKNDGVCKETTTSFECICKEGFACADCSCNTTLIVKQTTKETSCPNGFCKNGGSCYVTDRGYNCQCLDGFHGDDCAIPDLCKKNPCENGGVCVQVGADYKCICTYGFKGSNCRLPLSCVSHPCANGGTCHETDLDYKCTCTLGYKGLSCEDLNPCAHNPCANNAHCIEKGPFYTCLCEEGFRGKDCKEKDPCQPNPCMNGYCTELSVGLASCNCTEGWNGDLCEIRNECFPNRCLNGGTCTHNGVAYHCICTERFHGPSCELINPCHENPCQNNGVCQTTEIGFICACTDGYRGHHCEIGGHCHPNPCHHGGRCFEGDKEFICECSSGFAGKLCEIQDFCDPNPCHNNGQCIEEAGTYSCSCPFGFLGHHCEESICLPTPCKNGGTCIASNTEHGYACECVFPYHGHDCEEWDPCVPSPCKNGGTCKSHLKEISELHLHEGALQSLLHGADESVIDVVEPDEEGLGDNNFTIVHHPELYEEHDQATNSEVGHIPHVYLAKQLPRLHSEGIEALDNHLHADIDHAIAHEHDEALHHSITENGLPRIDSEYLTDHHDHYDVIHHHDIGYEEANSIHDSHLDGHPNEGEHPFTDHYNHLHNTELHADDHHSEATNFKDHSGGIQAEISSLLDHSHLDSDHEHVHADVHGPKTPGHTLDEAALEQITKNVVKAVLKHSEQQSNSKKSKIAKKIKAEIRKRTIQNLYVCECPPGFLGAHCQHANPCEDSPCKNGGVCIPRGKRYQCQCISGYAGLHCEDLHPCTPNPCQHNGACRLAHNTRGYHCDCTKGYKGYQCEKVDHCAKGNPCQHGGKCINTDVGIECRCRQRYGGNLCEVDKCEGCSQDAHCKQGHCVCKPGFIGNGYKCKSIGDICSPNPCENKGKCQPGQDGKIFVCQCDSGFTGSRCEFYNPCKSGPCKHNGVCVDNTNSRQKGIILVEHTEYKCFCPQGYRGKNCEETSLGACSSIPCLNNATCFDSSDEYHRKNLKHPDDFECFCRYGYSGKQCEIPHFGCWSHPCQNGGSCLDPSVLPEVSFDSHGYKCNCLPDFVGKNCEVTLHGPSPCFSAPCLHNGRCVDASSNNDPDLHFEDLNNYKCFCNVMYSGKNCEVPFPACTSAPCYHNGTCIDGTTHPDFNFDENGYHCLCAVGYEGKSCERQYVFASPEEEEQILHPTDMPDTDLLTPTPMVVYVRAPKTTPPRGTVEKAKPGIVIVQQRTTPKPMLDLPIEDISLKQAHDASHHAVVAEAVTDMRKADASASKAAGNRDDVHEVLDSLHHQPDHPPASTADQPQSTVVRIIPDTGLPGGAASVVNQVPKHDANEALSSRMVSLVPDKLTSFDRNAVPGENRQTVPVNSNTSTSASANAYWQQQLQQQQADMYAKNQAMASSAARSYAPQSSGYYGYQNYYNAETGQSRSLNSMPVSWQQTYNRILKQRMYNTVAGKRSKIRKLPHKS